MPLSVRSLLPGFASNFSPKALIIEKSLGNYILAKRLMLHCRVTKCAMIKDGNAGVKNGKACVVCVFVVVG